MVKLGEESLMIFMSGGWTIFEFVTKDAVFCSTYSS